MAAIQHLKRVNLIRFIYRNRRSIEASDIEAHVPGSTLAKALRVRPEGLPELQVLLRSNKI